MCKWKTLGGAKILNFSSSDIPGPGTLSHFQFSAHSTLVITDPSDHTTPSTQKEFKKADKRAQCSASAASSARNWKKLVLLVLRNSEAACAVTHKNNPLPPISEALPKQSKAPKEEINLVDTHKPSSSICLCRGRGTQLSAPALSRSPVPAVPP